MQQFQRGAAGTFVAGLPFLHRRHAGVEHAREYRLAQMIRAADFPDLRGRARSPEAGTKSFITQLHLCLRYGLDAQVAR